MNDKFGKWDIIFIHLLKRDRKKIIIRVMGLALFISGFVLPFEEIAKGDGLMGMFETLKNPAMVAMVGPTPSTDYTTYTLGEMYSHMMILYSGLFAMIISALHVISHTRGDEDKGIVEMIRSRSVGIDSLSLAVIIETILINLLIVLISTIVMISFNANTIDLKGALIYSLSIGIAGIIGGAIAFLTSQIMGRSSSAIGLTMGIIGILFILRAMTDISNPSLSDFNPMSWIYKTESFTNNNIWPLIAGFIFSLILMIISFILEGKRDIDEGYIKMREGKGKGNPLLKSIPALFLRLNKGIIIVWIITLFILGASYGSIYGDMEKFVESNELMKSMFTVTGVSVERSFTATLIVILVGLATILPLIILNRTYKEEKTGRFNQVYSTKIKRSSIYLWTIAFSIIAAILGVIATNGGLGLVAESVMTNNSISLSLFMKSGLNLLPSVIFFIALAALILGWVPKILNLIYVYLVYSFMLSYFSGALDLPERLIKTGPQSWLSKMPIDEFDSRSFYIVIAISIVMIIVGLIGYNKRDIGE